MSIKRIISPSDFLLPKINENVILFFNLNHFFMFRDYCSATKIKSFGPSKKYNFQHKGKSYTAIGGCIGAPLAVITLENAIESGGKHFFTFGSAGWLSDSEEQPSLISRISVVFDQTGISKDYGSISTTLQLENQKKTEKDYQIVSANSFYQLTKEKVQIYREQNIALIDMEIAPLFFITTLYKLSLNPLFVISDFVDKEFKWNNISHSPAFLEALASGFNRVINFQ